MAAFTEGFTDSSQPGKDHIGAMISKVIAARKFAREERELAEQKAKKAGYDSLEEIGVEKGFFFKAALKSKFGGSFISGKKEQFRQTVDRVKLLKNPKAQFWNFIDNRDADGKKVEKSSAVERFRAQFDNYAFVSAKRPPEVSPDDPAVPDTEKDTATAASGRGRGRVTRDDILQAVIAIAASLEKTAQSINNNVQESKDIASGIQAIHTDVVSQLSERTDTLESKLDALIAAINAQTNLQKQSVDQAETTQDITEQKQVSNTADAFNFDDLQTPEDEERQDDMQLDSNPAATSAQAAEFAQQDAYNNPPQAETGGIISGPDEGYMAKLHGDEMVIPLDNNYTQGQPSAMDGKVRPVPETPAIKPKTQSFETGTKSPKPSSNLGGKIGFTPMNIGAMTGLAGTDVTTKLSQPLMDAMSLPMMVAGGTVLSSVSNMMNALGPENAEFAGEIAKVARPVADVFGLPNTLSNKVTGSSKSQKDEKTDPKKEKEENKKKGMLSKLTDGIKKLLGVKPGGGSGGGGGGGSGEPPVAKNVPEGREDKIAAALKFYKEKGLSDEGASYMVGNLLQESGLRPDAVGDNGQAFGLAQWRIDEKSGARWKGFQKWAKDNNKDTGDFIAQLEYTLVEGETYNKGLTTLKGTDKKAIMDYIEAYEGYSEEGSRFSYGEDILQNIDRYRSGATPPSKNNPPKPGQAVDAAQAISQNFGLKTNEKFFFDHNGDTYEAYKTTKGFRIFKYGTELNTTGQNLGVVNALIQAGNKSQQQSLKPPANPSGADTKPGTETASALQPTRKTQGSTGGTTVVAMAGAAQSKTTNTTQRPDSSQAVGEGGDNNLRAMYNPNGVVA